MEEGNGVACAKEILRRDEVTPVEQANELGQLSLKPTLILLMAEIIKKPIEYDTIAIIHEEESSLNHLVEVEQTLVECEATKLDLWLVDVAVPGGVLIEILEMKDFLWMHKNVIKMNKQCLVDF
ncbi:hypothetical protein HAX54_018175 [Datura stramonium]|uniref:Uncharacterized protein n=1 Tax=Datura stramonium TaxID=4076 RepID=A0ABS8UNG5_DATST|nr:hypothetical protein [Datura stramonium]